MYPAPPATSNRLVVGRDEIHLASLPFTRRKNDGNPILKSWTAMGVDGKLHNFFWNVTKPPSTHAEDVLVALINIGIRTGQPDQIVETYAYEVLQVMKRNPGGSSYERITNAIEALRVVKIQTNAIWDEKNQAYVRNTFGFIQRYYDVMTRREIIDSATMFGVEWTNIFYERLAQSTIGIDLDLYFELDNAMARRLYRHINRMMLLHGYFKQDLGLLASVHMGLSSNRLHLSQLDAILSPATKELEEKGIARFEVIRDESAPSQFSVIFTAKDYFTNPRIHRFDRCKMRRVAAAICHHGFETTPGRQDGMEELLRLIEFHEYAVEDLTEMLEEYRWRLELSRKKEKGGVRSPAWIRWWLEKGPKSKNPSPRPQGAGPRPAISQGTLDFTPALLVEESDKQAEKEQHERYLQALAFFSPSTVSSIRENAQASMSGQLNDSARESMLQWAVISAHAQAMISEQKKKGR
jgi:hypothetical protein